MFSIRSVTNLFALENVSAGSLVLFGKDGTVIDVPGQTPNNPLFIIDATTNSVTVNGTLALADGTVATPSLSFINSSNTGVYMPSVGELGLVTSGSNPVIIKLNEIDFSNKILTNIGTNISGGTAAALSIDNIKSIPTSTLKISDQKFESIINSVNKLIVSGTNIETTVPVYSVDGTVALPSYTFSADLNTGIYRPSADTLGFTTGGVERVNISETKTTISNLLETSLIIPSISVNTLVATAKVSVTQGDKIYAVDDSVFKVIDVSLPNVTQVLGSVTLSGQSNNLFIYGRYAYAVGVTIHIVDIQNPSTPIVVGTIPEVSGRVTGVYVQGNRLYVSSSSSQFNIYDISSPNNPTLLGRKTEINAGYDIVVKDNIAFLAGDNRITSYDVSNPLLIIRIGATAIVRAGKISIVGDYIFTIDTSNNASRNLNIINIADPANMRVSGFLDLANIDLSDASLSSLYILGKYALVGIINGPAIYVINILDVTAPSFETKLTTNNFVNSFSLVGQHLYVFESSGNMLTYELDVTTINNIEVGSISTTNLRVKEQTVLENNLTLLGGAYMNSLDVKGSLSVKGLRFPAADGTPGQSIITDGSGNLTFGSTDAEPDPFLDGSVSSPSIAFKNDLTTGVYRPNTSEINIVLGGVIKANFSTNGTNFYNSYLSNSITLTDTANTNQSDIRGAYYLNGETGTLTNGLFGNIGDGGVSVYSYSATDNLILGTNRQAAGKTITMDPAGNLKIDDGIIKNTLGSLTNPSYTFIGDENTGMYRPGTDTLGFTAAGTQTMTHTSSLIDCKTQVNMSYTGSVNNVALSWGNDNSLGFWSDSNTSLGMGAGSSKLQITSNGIAMSKGVDHPTISDSSVIITVTAENYLIRLTSNVNQTVNLPSASSFKGRQLVFYKKVSGGVATVTATGGDTIDGTDTTLALSTQFDRCVMVSDGEDAWISI
jgi:hypothetical protein